MQQLWAARLDFRQLGGGVNFLINLQPMGGGIEMFAHGL